MQAVIVVATIASGQRRQVHATGLMDSKRTKAS
jgi:hypothetical protein